MKKIIFIFLITCAFAACKGRGGTSSANAAWATDSAALVKPGDAAPLFELTNSEGAQVSLASLKGKYVLIVFFATWCPYCGQELIEIQQLYAQYGNNKNFRMLVIGREENADTLAQFCKDNKFTFPVFADEDRSVYALFAQSGIPRTYLVNPEGAIIQMLHGFEEEADLSEIRKALKKM